MGAGLHTFHAAGIEYVLTVTLHRGSQIMCRSRSDICGSKRKDRALWQAVVAAGWASRRFLAIHSGVRERAAAPGAMSYALPSRIDLDLCDRPALVYLALRASPGRMQRRDADEEHRNLSTTLSRTRFPWTQNWLNRSVQGGPEHDR